MNTRQDSRPFPVSLHPADVEVPPEIAERLLLRLAQSTTRSPLAQVTQYLGPLHLGLLTLLYDLGQLPEPERLSSSRDISPLIHSLADLESLELIVRDEDTIVAAPHVLSDLRDALLHIWTERADNAAAALNVPQGESKPRAPRSLVRRWLRVLVIQIASRGLRQTRNGILHLGDLRNLQKACTLPSERLLNNCLEVARGLEIIQPLGEQLLVGDPIDLLDLPDYALAQTTLLAWANGTIQLGHSKTLSMLGLFQRWLDPLRRMLEKNVHIPERPVWENALHETLAPDPCSGFFEPSLLTEEALVELVRTHRRTRAGLLVLIAGLPRARPIPFADVAELISAHAALDALKHPKQSSTQLGLVAAASRVLRFMDRRIFEDLRHWLNVLMVPHGLVTFHPQGTMTVSSSMPTPEHITTRDVPFGKTWNYAHPSAHIEPSDAMSQVGGRIISQPNGELMVPPDASIHALLHIAQGAQIEKLDQMSVFALTRRSLMRVTDAGMSLEIWAEALAELAKSPLPATITRLIDDVARRQGEMVIAPAGGILIAEDPVRMAELMSYKHVARHVVHQPSPTVVVLDVACDLQQLMGQIADRGFSALFLDRPHSEEEVTGS